jgi:flagellar motor switch protein FliN/FliY
MSATPSDQVAAEIDLYCRAADAAAAALAVGERLAGPAAAQEDVGQLLVAEDLRGAWAELADGTVVVVFAATESLSPGAQGPEGDGVVIELGPALEAAATALGLPAGSPRPIVEIADLPVALTDPSSGRTLVGAGVFEGEAPVASVGVAAPAAASPAPATPATTTPDAGAAEATPPPTGPRNLRLLADVELGISAELGRTTMSMGELLDLQPGGVIELQRTVGTPIDVMVNGTLIARGEVVVVEDAYAVRVTEVVSEQVEG